MLSLVGVAVGCVLFGLGIITGAHIWVFVGLVVFPLALMYGLVGGGYSSGDSRSH
jgi:hypothetical protein